MAEFGMGSCGEGFLKRSLLGGVVFEIAPGASGGALGEERQDGDESRRYNCVPGGGAG
jgi:hypothetical protein